MLFSDNLDLLGCLGSEPSVPDTDVKDRVQADISSTGKVFLILAHLDGLQPLIHRAHAELWRGWFLTAGIQKAQSHLNEAEPSGFITDFHSYSGQ